LLSGFDEENKVTTKNATSRFHSNQIILNGKYFKTHWIKHGKNSNQSKQHVAMLNLMFEVSFTLKFSNFGLINLSRKHRQYSRS
jgi:hypothetical protein